MTKKLFQIAQSVLNIDDLYRAFIYNKPKNKRDCQSNYQAILHKLIQDGADIYLDTENNINVTFNSYSALQEKFDNTLKKIVKNNQISYLNNSIIFPAEILQNRKNMNIILTDLAENSKEQHLIKTVVSVANDKISATKTAPYIALTIIMVLAVATGIVLMGTGFATIPAMIAVGISSIIGISSTAYCYNAYNKLDTIKESDYKEIKKAYDNVKEDQIQHTREKKSIKTRQPTNFRKIAQNAKKTSNEYSR